MTHIEYEEKRLKRMVFEMMMLVSDQLLSAQKALFNNDQEVAEEVIHNEDNVNSYELSIDRDCHDILALQNPVATDLRFVLAMYKINSELERIGDHAMGIAKFTNELEGSFKKHSLNSTKLEEMFSLALEMMELTMEAFENNNADLARKIFKKDKALNKINKQAADAVLEIINKSPDRALHALLMFSTIKKLERIGDLCKNIAEQLIYYLEAKVLKHKKKKWKV